MVDKSIENDLLEMEKDLFKPKRFWENILGSDSYYLNDERVVNILADKRIIAAVKKYDGNVAKKIASRLTYFAYDLRDKDVVVEIATILSSDEIVNVVKKYSGDAAEEVASSLAEAAYVLRDKYAVIKIANTVSKYDGNVAEEVALGLVDAAYVLRDKYAVIKIATILSSDEIVNVVKKYSGDATRGIVLGLAKAAYDLRDKDVVVEIATILSSDEIVNVVKKYSGDAAEEVARKLVYIAYDLRDKTKVIRIVKILEKVGKDMFDLLKINEIREIIDENLDRLVSDKSSFNAVVAYIKSKKELPKLDESNIKDYNNLALDYVKRKYGLKKDISINQIIMLFDVPENIRNEVIDLVNKFEEKNVKYYSLETEYVKSLNYSKDELKKYAIISIVGSRNKELENQAIDAIASIVGMKTVYRARNEFNSKYKHLMKDIIAAFNQGDYDKALDILRQTENEPIIDVINAVYYRDVDISSARFIRAVESKNPLDYDNRVQMACVYLPSGAKREEILNYCKDNKFVLVRYDVGNQTLGSAICYIKDNIFLVDSVEGHRRFRNDKIFEIVFKDLIERARENGAYMVVFNIDVQSETSRKFIEYLSKKNLPKGRIEMRLDTDAYLEAKKDGVNGYVVKL
jgi:hypothetical protein